MSVSSVRFGRIRAAAVAAAVATALVGMTTSGCSSGGASSDSSPAGAPSGGGGGGGAASARPPGTIPPTVSVVPLVSERIVGDEHGNKLAIAPAVLRRTGNLLLLGISVRNITPASAGEDDFNIVFTLPSGDIAYTGASLVDPKHGKLYVVAQDSKEKYLATSYGGGLSVPRGGTGLVEAYYAAPPSDVTTLNVTLNKIGTFVDVPVS